MDEEIDKIIEHLLTAACGYGLAKNKERKEIFKKCIYSIPQKHLQSFLYTLYRIAEKSGPDGFNR